MRGWIVAFVIVWGAAGCSGGSPAATTTGSATICAPGQSVACVGVGGCQGGQVCATDGKSYGACQCGQGTTTGATTTGGQPTTGGGSTTVGGTTGGGTTGGTTGGGTTGGATGNAVPIGLPCSGGSCDAGQVCVGEGSSDPFCTVICGEGVGEEAPDGGQQLCASEPTPGDAAGCYLNAGNSDGGATWFCMLLCGGDAGDCPPNLTCSFGLCQ